MENKNKDDLFRFVVLLRKQQSVQAILIILIGSLYSRTKKKSAVVMSCVFFALVIFSFVALWIGKYDFATLKSDSALAFQNPNSEFWFGTDNLGRDYWCQVWYAAQTLY